MKGLLLKDWYLMSKYCRAVLFMIIVFIAISFSTDEKAFFLMYPCVITSMIPMTLCSYDEREKWCAYSLTLPVSKAMYVSAKYIMGLLVNIASIVLIGAALACRMLSAGAFDMLSYLSTMGVIILATMLIPSVLMPFVYKLGTEKARIAYFGVIVVAFAGSAVFSVVAQDAALSVGGVGGFVMTVAVVAVAYAVSWLISIRLYNKRAI